MTREWTRLSGIEWTWDLGEGLMARATCQETGWPTYSAFWRLAVLRTHESIHLQYVHTEMLVVYKRRNLGWRSVRKLADAALDAWLARPCSDPACGVHLGETCRDGEMDPRLCRHRLTPGSAS